MRPILPLCLSLGLLLLCHSHPPLLPTQDQGETLPLFQEERKGTFITVPHLQVKRMDWLTFMEFTAGPSSSHLPLPLFLSHSLILTLSLERASWSIYGVMGTYGRVWISVSTLSSALRENTERVAEQPSACKGVTSLSASGTDQA